ncbi:helix-turn-helix domain-containing protein [Croceicoccus sp. Ery5]|jgi:transcriptional regulator with XRE-family HTH domain|uniref:helix-turn-helix domain-containing protein n=1 Tax=Croceicoccus sp. Ery5 TaxID=1703340 RepID=UPI001E46DFCB|nr:helix-turn-helix transcriptional regulator [Croceicoccus sp. Ery5]
MIDIDQIAEIPRDLTGVSERLRLAREHACLSQELFAERLGYTRRQVNSWENGASAPPIWALMGVRILCDIDPEWVLFGPGKNPVRDFSIPDVDRLPRLIKEVEKMARSAAIELPHAAIINLAQLIAREAPEAEKKAKRQVAATLRAIVVNE